MQNIANHSDMMIKLNLQFFAEEDAILPDDFQSEPQGEVEDGGSMEEEPEVTDSGETESAGEDSAEETTSEETSSELPQTIKVKFNKEEREIPWDEAQSLVQKGLNYDKQIERLQQLESDPRLSFVESLAQQNGMDVNEFIESFQRAQEEAQLNELVQQNIPEELAREIMENKKFRDQYESERQAKEQEEAKNADFMEFFQYFREANGRDFNTETDQLPQEVWDASQSGVPLKFAYMQHEVNQLRSQIKTKQTNETNKKRAPIGSVTKHGGDNPSGSDPFLSGFDSI